MKTETENDNDEKTAKHPVPQAFRPKKNKGQGNVLPPTKRREPIWKQLETDGSPLKKGSGAKVIIADDQYGLHAYDKNGWPVWNVEIPEVNHGKYYIGKDGVVGLPKEFGGDLVAYARLGDVYGINTRTGRIEWRKQSYGALEGVSAIGQTKKYAIITHGEANTQVVRLSDGKPAWSVDGDWKLSDYNEKYCALISKSSNDINVIKVVRTEDGTEVLNLKRKMKDDDTKDVHLYDGLLSYVERTGSSMMRKRRITVMNVESGTCIYGKTAIKRREKITDFAIHETEDGKDVLLAYAAECGRKKRGYEMGDPIMYPFSVVKVRPLDKESGKGNSAPRNARTDHSWDNKDPGHVTRVAFDAENGALVVERQFLIDNPTPRFYTYAEQHHIESYGLNYGRKEWDVSTGIIREVPFGKSDSTYFRTNGGHTYFKNMDKELCCRDNIGATSSIELFKQGNYPQGNEYATKQYYASLCGISVRKK